MSKRFFTEARPAVFKMLFAVLFGFAALVTAGCDEPDDAGGVSISSIPLATVPPDPPDVALNLSCDRVGIFTETCVLDDPENPFRNAGIVEFNENNEEAFNKFELANAIPPGPAGAKSRFYFWATALARLPIGENQYFAARALHELYTAQIQVSGVGDPIVRDQTLAAYRSMLDNFFSSATFFACDFRDGVFRGCPAPDFDPALDDRGLLPLVLNEQVADSLYRREATVTLPDYPEGFARLLEGTFPDQGVYQVFIQSLLGEWGYSYQPATPPDFNDGVVSVNDG